MSNNENLKLLLHAKLLQQLTKQKKRKTAARMDLLTQCTIISLRK